MILYNSYGKESPWSKLVIIRFKIVTFGSNCFQNFGFLELFLMLGSLIKQLVDKNEETNINLKKLTRVKDFNGSSLGLQRTSWGLDSWKMRPRLGRTSRKGSASTVTFSSALVIVSNLFILQSVFFSTSFLLMSLQVWTFTITTLLSTTNSFNWNISDQTTSSSFKIPFDFKSHSRILL